MWFLGIAVVQGGIVVGVFVIIKTDAATNKEKTENNPKALAECVSDIKTVVKDFNDCRLECAKNRNGGNCK